jgi:hypothetical protein
VAVRASAIRFIAIVCGEHADTITHSATASQRHLEVVIVSRSPSAAIRTATIARPPCPPFVAAIVRTPLLLTIYKSELYALVVRLQKP